MLITLDNDGFMHEIRHGQMVDEFVEEIDDDFDIEKFNYQVIIDSGNIPF